MKNMTAIFLSLLLVQSLSASSQSKTDYKYLPDQIVVKLAQSISDVSSVQSLSARISLAKGIKEAVKPLVITDQLKHPARARKIGLNRIYTVRINPQSDLPRYCQELMLDPAVEWAEPVYLMPLYSEPNDMYYIYQEHLPQIHMPEAWDVGKGDSSVVIAIIDTGVDYLHEDLKDVIWVNDAEDLNGDGMFTWPADSNGIDDDDNGFIDDVIGWDWVTGVSGTDDYDARANEDGEDVDNNPRDVDGHGTHCSGLAAATTNNTVGLAGVSWGCSVMPLRVGYAANDGNGYVPSVWASQAFIYAADNGAKVANFSAGNSQSIMAGAQYAFENDVAIATSAGNSSSFITDPLSVVPWTLAVTAVNANNIKTAYSSFGLDAAITAPGGGDGIADGVMSTIPNNQYARKSGTSMASPVVAGVLGLVRSNFPDWSASEALYQVVGTADNIDNLNPAYAGLLGGLVNGYRALTETVVPKPKIALDKVEINDDGNHNGVADPGETVQIVTHFINRWAPCPAATIKLLVDDKDAQYFTVNTDESSIDSIYGLEDANYDHNNSALPFELTLVNSIPPSMFSMAVVMENSVISDTFKFAIPIHPMVLFVDDHLGGGGTGDDVEIRHYYDEVLNELGIVYDYWLNQDSPDSALITNYPIVIWACEWAFPSLAEGDRGVLAHYLENGGNLFLSGQDLAWDMMDPEATTYQDSEGASKTWMENYIGVDFISDAGGVGPLSPADGSFFTLPAFDFHLPNRDADNQYPDELSPRTGASALLNYSTGTAGAVGADSPYSTVFFSFGGLEAVSDKQIRKEAARQIISHFAQLNIAVSELKNTESVGPFTVDAQVETENALTITDLWYRYNNGLWQQITMTDQGSGHYSADLPAVTGDTDIEYFVFFKTSENVYNAKLLKKFHSGPDSEAPVANSYYYYPQTVDKSGVYSVAVSLDDYVSVDTANVKLFYSASTGYQDSVLMNHFDKNVWKGTITLPNTLEDGNSLSYHMTFNDLAQVVNSDRFPVSGELSFTVSDSAMIDDFESSINQWINDDNVWSFLTDSLLILSGHGALISGDGNSYPHSRNTSVELHYPINLQGRTSATLYYDAVLRFESSSDSAFFEVREGNGEWTTLITMAARSKSWSTYEADLTPYCGVGHDPVSIRFRFMPDDNTTGTNRWGIIIDDVRITVDRLIINSIDDAALIPAKFELQPAYPNPFNAAVNIPYSIPDMGEVQLHIYDIMGHEVYGKTATHKTPGYYDIYWNGRSDQGKILTSGIYFIQLQYGQKIETRKIMFLK